ncbi:MAG: glycerol-3-phosphate dehydrogenase subunit GlpB [Desulfobacter sp.]
MNKDMHCDLLVIGAGLAGMSAAVRAAQKGLDTVVAGNPSSLVFASGLMDYLGVYPAGSSTCLDSPLEGRDALVRDFPGHAYAAAGHENILECFAFIRNILDQSGLAYKTAEKEGNNLRVITAMGTIKPSFMVPETMMEGCRALARGSRDTTLAVAGIRGLQGFSASQVAEGVSGLFSETVPIRTELPGITTVVPPQILAEHMEDPVVLDAFAGQVAPRARHAGLLGIPAVCGIDNSQSLVKGLSDRLGIPVFEIPCSPPSIPGLRLKKAFERSLGRSGVRLLSNTRMQEPVFDGERFTLTGRLDPDAIRVHARGVVLATGRFFGHGLHARRERIVETVFRLDVTQPLGRHLWHDKEFLALAGHRINRAGIDTDAVFRPLDARGRPVYPHLYVAGGLLAHNDWLRLKSGAGVSLVSAMTAVDHFTASAGGGHGH